MKGNQMLSSYDEIKKQVTDEWDYFASDWERAIQETADSLVPVYTGEIIREWTELSSDDSDRWQELGTDGSAMISDLMAIDLFIFYEAQVSLAYHAVLNEKYGEEEAN
jgi:hypothetical protein